MFRYIHYGHFITLIHLRILTISNKLIIIILCNNSSIHFRTAHSPMQRCIEQYFVTPHFAVRLLIGYVNMLFRVCHVQDLKIQSRFCLSVINVRLLTIGPLNMM